MTAWANPDHEALLRKLWAEGFSASQLATKINHAFRDASYSRNAVIGKVHRLKLPRRAAVSANSRYGLALKDPTKASNASRKRRASPAVAGSGAVTENPPSPPPRLPVKEAAFTPLKGVEPVPFGSPGCKWPVGGEGADLLTCGATRQDGRPYCTTHVHAARGRWQPDEPEAVETLPWRLAR
jgi:GcrA cell cycle regulator